MNACRNPMARSHRIPMVNNLYLLCNAFNKALINHFMRTSYFFIVFLITISACKKSNTGNCTPEKKEYTFQAGKQIDHQKRITTDTTFEYYTFSVKDGDKNVFNFTWQFQDCLEVADDEGSRIILFEMPQNVNSFLLKDSADLRTAKVLVNYACFCYPSGPVLVTRGTIEGQKKSGNVWHLKGCLKPFPNYADTIDFEADFILK